VDLDARMAARVLPVLEDMRMTIDDHRYSLDVRECRPGGGLAGRSAYAAPSFSM
jgi:hypothetical protein